jgi:hypothetical protein
MSGPELKQLRHDLGDAIGKRLSTADMATIVGLAPANGADTWRKWEDGAGPSGPVAAQLQLLQLASTDYEIPRYMLVGASTTCNRFGIDFRGGIPAENIFREMILAEVRQRLEHR